jgi:hypothetical protein
MCDLRSGRPSSLWFDKLSTGMYGARPRVSGGTLQLTQAFLRRLDNRVCLDLDQHLW